MLASASGGAEPPTREDTKAVVAICVLLVPAAGVGAVGVPVKDGEAIVALNAMSLGRFDMVAELTPQILLTVG